MIAEFQQLKHDYMTAHSDVKRNLETRINELRTQLAIWVHGGGDAGGFDWPVEFAEVLASGGFDIVLANPHTFDKNSSSPKASVEADLWGMWSGTADLYVFFYYRALELLKPTGALAFISSNKWFKAAYGVKLRRRMSTATAIRSITDFGDLPVFEGASAYAMIFICQSARTDGTGVTRYTNPPSLESPYPDIHALIQQHGIDLPVDSFKSDNWLLAEGASAVLIRTMNAGTSPLKYHVNEGVFRGVLTGLNEAFVIDGATRERLIQQDAASAEIIVPLATGKDIRQWRVTPRDR